MFRRVAAVLGVSVVLVILMLGVVLFIAVVLILGLLRNAGATDDARSAGSEPAAVVGDAHGFVEVDGTTFTFTYDYPGQMCGIDTVQGRVTATGVLVDNPNMNVTITYALGEWMEDGNPVLQIIVDDGNGDQLWYSAVGFTPTPAGSIDSLTVDGSAVHATGTLQTWEGDTERLAQFSAEATCERPGWR
jgi:hypothetical protein